MVGDLNTFQCFHNIVFAIRPGFQIDINDFFNKAVVECEILIRHKPLQIHVASCKYTDDIPFIAGEYSLNANGYISPVNRCCSYY